MINVANGSHIQVRLGTCVNVVIGRCLHMSDAERRQTTWLRQPPAGSKCTHIGWGPGRKTYRLTILQSPQLGLFMLHIYDTCCSSANEIFSAPIRCRMALQIYLVSMPATLFCVYRCANLRAREDQALRPRAPAMIERLIKARLKDAAQISCTLPTEACSECSGFSGQPLSAKFCRHRLKGCQISVGCYMLKLMHLIV